MRPPTLPSDLESAVPFCPHYGTCGSCPAAARHRCRGGSGRPAGWRMPWRSAACRCRAQESAMSWRKGRAGAASPSMPGSTAAGRRRLHGRQEPCHRPDRVCPVAVSALRLAPAIVAALAAARRTFRQMEYQLTASASGIDCDLRGCDPSPERRSRLAAAAGALDVARLTCAGDRLRCGASRWSDGPRHHGAAAGVLPAGNGAWRSRARPAGERGLRRRPPGGGPVLRPRSVCAAAGRNRAVLAYDFEAAAILALRQAAAHASGLKPVVAQRAISSAVPLGREELGAVDAVVFDPPRQPGSPRRACRRTPQAPARSSPSLCDAGASPATRGSSMMAAGRSPALPSSTSSAGRPI